MNDENLMGHANDGHLMGAKNDGHLMGPKNNGHLMGHANEEFSRGVEDEMLSDWRAHKRKIEALVRMKEDTPEEWKEHVRRKAVALYNATHPALDSFPWTGPIPELELEETAAVLSRVLEMIKAEREIENKQWEEMERRDEESRQFGRMMVDS